MQRKPIDKALLLGVPAFLLALLVLNITAEGEVKLGATLGSVGLCVSYYSFLRSGGVSRRYPIEDLIEKDGESLVFHYFHRHERHPLKVNVNTIYALNFSHRYLGVILDNNGKGFDFHYPHKEAVIKARLQEVLGDDGFNNIKKNV